MKAVVVVNPVAGGRSRLAPSRREAIARAALSRAGVDGDVVVTERAGQGREIAQAAVDSGCELVVAWGGDGTINEVASALVGRNAALGIVRAGSGNGFARELGVPARPALALDAALSGPDCVIDTGEIDGRFFVNLAGIGFDAMMAARFGDLGSERRGALRYAASILRSSYAYRPTEYAIEADGEQWRTRALLVAIANLPQYGTNAVIAPQAVPFDGRLDVVAIGERGTFGRVALVPRAFAGSIDRARGVAYRAARRIVVSADRPMAFHVDGEPVLGGTVIEARIRPRSLRIRGVGHTRWPDFFDSSAAGILET